MKTMPSGAVTLLVGLALTTSIVLSARTTPQDPQRPVVRSGTELVQVDVVVLDEGGVPVRGLTASDFTLLDRKRRQRIDAFSEINHEWNVAPGPKPPADVRADVADNSTSKSERIVILLIHDLGLWKERVDLAKDLARRVVEDLGPESSMAVLFSSGRGGTEITEDRATLLKAIDGLRGQYWEMRAGPDGVNRAYFQRTIQDIARYLGVEETRRKALVVITEGGIPDALGLFDRMQPRPEADPIHSPKAPSAEDIALITMMEALRKANAVMYAVDPRGRVETSAERFRENRGGPVLKMLDPVYRSQEGFRLASEASGGFAVTNTNDFGAGLQRILFDLDHYYMLGFYPDAETDRKWHPLEVSVNRPGMTVRHRVGYRPGAPVRTAPPKNKDPLVQLSAGILPRTDLPLRLVATPVALSAKSARVAVTVEVRAPMTALAGPDGSVADSVHLTLLAADLKKKKVTRRVNRDAGIALIDPKPSAAGEVTYQVVMGIDLPPGPYQLRASAKSDRLGKSGSVYLMIDVPPLPETGVAILGPALGLARERFIDETMKGELLPLRPVLDRVFTSADTMRVVYWLAPGKSSGSLSSVVEVLDEHEQAVFRADQSAAAKVDIDVPLTGLKPGGYRLRVKAGGDAGTMREIGFAVAAAR
jgi:VWFA-related protein